MKEDDIDQAMLDDDGYREWSETIEKQNQEHQDFVMLNYDTFDAFLADLANPNSGLREKFRKAGLEK